MCTRIFYGVLFSAWFFLNTLPTSYALTINVQYAPGTLFYPGIDATAKATINAAAADVSDAISTYLNGISTDVFTGTNGSTTATLDWSFNYTNPSTGGSATIDSATIAPDTVTLFVGTRSLYGNTLGEGGPTGLGLSLRASGFPNESPPAVNNAAAQSELALTRGGGPVIGSLGGNFDFSGVVTSYQVDYGISYGSLALDNDSNDNGSPDSSTALDNYWHWNYTTPVASGKSDLYTVALHEILHALGMGVSNSWNAMRGGTTWYGSEVQAITGSGSNLVDASGGHITSSLMSTRISDGSPQEVVMDPTITTGSRKELTVLDLAFLRDIGYETITPTLPSPPDYDGDGDVDAADLATLENGYGINSNGDTDDDGDTDGADFLAWQQQYTESQSPLANVPEPTSACLLLLGFVMMGCRRLREKTCSD